MTAPGEQARGVVMPVQVYPMFEQALPHRPGPDVDGPPRGHLRAVEPASAQVAADEPARLDRSRRTRAEEIRTPAPGQPLDRLPVHEAHELQQRGRAGRRVDPVLGGAGRGPGRAPRPLGVPRTAAPTPTTTTSSPSADDLRSSPAIALAGRAALELAGVGVDDLAHVDLYSCFPSRGGDRAPTELGLGHVDRPLTVTGGLSFAGGPWNNYVSHSIATMAERAARGRRAASAWSPPTAASSPSTRSASTAPSRRPSRFRHADLQAEVDALPSRSWTRPPTGRPTSSPGP